MFDGTGLKHGDAVNIQFAKLDEIEDAFVHRLVSRLLDYLEVENLLPITDTFIEAGEVSLSGYVAVNDTVSFPLPWGGFAGLWPNEAGECYTRVD